MQEFSREKPDWLKIRPPKTVEGLDLFQLLAGRGLVLPNYVFTDESSSAKSVRTDRWKLAFAPTMNNRQEAYAFFDLKNDPGETRDVSSEEEAVFADLKKELERYLAQYANEKKSPVILPEQVRENLRSLGYLQ